MTKTFKGKQVLITGGAGFIGSNLAIKLVKEEAEVIILDSMLPEYGGNLFNIDSIKEIIHINFSDMRDPYTLPFLVKNKDYIFNLAGQVSHMDSLSNPLVDLDINVKAQITLLEACRNYNQDAIIVYTSTRQFYGKPQYLPVDEKHPLNPPDFNGINKFSGELYHLLYHKIYGLKTTALRLTNTYGPRQLIKNFRQGFIGWFVNRVITNQPIQLFGGGEQIRDFSYVDDVVGALLLAANNPNCYGSSFNLSGEKSSLKDLANIMISIAKQGQVEIVPFPEKRKKIDIGDFYGDSSLFQKTTGWKPRTRLQDGIKATIDYYQKYKRFYI